MAELETIGSEVERQVQEARRGPWIVSRYRVSRLYGGPEEGGWWVDWYDLQDEESRGPFSDWEDAIEARDDLMTFEHPLGFKPERFSVIGGPDVMWVLEKERGDQQTRSMPRYE